MKSLSSGFRLPKTNYEIIIFEKGNLDNVVDTRVCDNQAYIKFYLSKFDSSLYDYSITLIGGCSSW